jgi:hypothetical protein
MKSTFCFKLRLRRSWEMLFWIKLLPEHFNLSSWTRDYSKELHNQVFRVKDPLRVSIKIHLPLILPSVSGKKFPLITSRCLLRRHDKLKKGMTS